MKNSYYGENVLFYVRKLHFGLCYKNGRKKNHESCFVYLWRRWRKFSLGALNKTIWRFFITHCVKNFIGSDTYSENARLIFGRKACKKKEAWWINSVAKKMLKWSADQTKRNACKNKCSIYIMYLDNKTYVKIVCRTTEMCIF